MGEENKFGDLLRRHRLAAGLTQANLADRAGVSLRGLSDIERGRRAAPHRDTILRLANALQLDQLPVDAGHSGLRPFASLARSIEADYAAVVNCLKLPWSTGPVEDAVTRVKLLKRQGNGRPSTRLLRRRVVSAA